MQWKQEYHMSSTADWTGPVNHPLRFFQALAEMFYWLLQSEHIVMERAQRGTS